jgi:predicted permease
MRGAGLYGALLRFYPAAFRDEYGDEMRLLFAEQMDEARRSGSRVAAAALWVRAAFDTFTVAPREHGHVLAQDLRYAWRTTRSRPGFAAVAIASLALGLGANTAIFSLWNGVLHAPLPVVARPEQLVILTNPDESGSWTGRWHGQDGPRSWITFGEFEALRDHLDGVSGLMATESRISKWPIRVGDGAWEEARGRLVSGGFFEVLGVRPQIGRTFTAAEDQAETPSAVISHDYWQRRFGGRPDVLGLPLTVRRAPLTVIGVAPPGFVGETSGQRPDLWVSLRWQPKVLAGRDRLHDKPPEKAMWLHAFGRLEPGVTVAQVEAQANAIFQSGLESFYGAALAGPRRSEFLDQRLRLQPGGRGASSTRHEFSQSLTALLAAVAILMLIACVNLANLLLARGAAQRSEIALRLSLGASRGRLIRQLVTESAALAAVGGLAALGVASVLHTLLVRMMVESDPRFHMRFDLDPTVLGFLLAATLGAAFAFGVLPAWQATKTDAGASLKERSRGGAGAMGAIRSSRYLVGLQIALSLPLLVGAGLLARTVYNLKTADLGFGSRRLALVRVDLREKATDAAHAHRMTREMLTDIQRIPGVRSATFSHLGLFSGGNSAETVEFEGYVGTAGEDLGTGYDVVGPGYFSTLGIPVRQGREILESDGASTVRVCVINEALARRYFAGRDPLGKRITSVADDSARTAYEIVGVAQDAHTRDVRGPVEPRFFVSAAQPPASDATPTFLVRTSVAAGPVVTAVRKAIASRDASLPILLADTIEGQMEPLLAQDRITARLALVFGGVALALAAIGLYGVLSYGVARRAGEIAVRIALGARRSRVVGMILRETSGLVLAGLAVGGLFAYGASRFIGSQLYGVTAQDPLILAAATGVLVLVALSAASLPAHRASRVDPMVVLRQE